MAHVGKYGRGAIGSLTSHFERRKNENGAYYAFNNQDIDYKKIHLNYNLAPAVDQREFIKKRLSEVKCLNRTDVKVMCSWVVTKPKDVTSEEQELFFKESYDFLKNRYGEKNIISCYVHLDEITPHMHFAFIPVVIDKNKNIEKVSAKECINKKDLQTFHKDYEKYISGIFNRNIGITNGATKDGNLTVAELKLKTKKEKIKNQIFQYDEKSKELENKILELENKSKGIDEQYNALICVENSLRSVKNNLVALDIIKSSKTLLGGKLAILEGDYNNLLQKAKLGIVYTDKINQFDKLLEENKSLKSQIEKNKSFKLNEIKEKANNINRIKVLEYQNSKMQDFIISRGLSKEYNATVKQDITPNKLHLER